MRRSHTNSGISVLGDVPWGSHFCQFYHTPADLLDTLVPYFLAGLQNHEFCMWVTSEPVTRADAIQAMREVLPDVETYLNNGQLEILPYSEWYIQGGAFNPDRVLQGWADKHNTALAQGYSGLRLTGNTLWLEQKDWGAFTAYERAIDGIISNYRMLALCTYQGDRCGLSEVADVMSNHQFALIKRQSRWQIIESTERKRVEQLKDDILSVAAHEIRTPLAVIKGNSQLLLRRAARGTAALGETEMRLLQSIDERTDYLADLMNDLLDFSRIELGRLPLHSEATDLPALLRQIAAHQQLLHPDTPLALELSDRALYGMWDRRRLEQVFTNLLDNAIKYSPPGRPVVVRVSPAGEQARVAVQDEGMGVPAGDLPHLFERNFRASNVERSPAGLGLGLYITRHIVERHGGRIWAESAEGAGSTFHVELPLMVGVSG